ncbi:MAG: hypothetical protein LBE12_00580 [Planctomycetaceae bacterium]|jgi:hypothetical protein|nr:hypothetical protein [Planctomycetaceae bacterium]
MKKFISIFLFILIVSCAFFFTLFFLSNISCYGGKETGCIRGECQVASETPQIPKCNVVDIPAEVSAAHQFTKCNTSKVYQDMTCDTIESDVPVSIYKVIVSVNESNSRLILCKLKGTPCATCLAAFHVAATAAGGAACAKFSNPVAIVLCATVANVAFGDLIKETCGTDCAAVAPDPCCFIDISLSTSPVRTESEKRIICRW